jgi:dTDP-4-dehydrorhamnose 3,5-epimerase
LREAKPVLLPTQVFEDDRGFFLEAFNKREFEAIVGHPVDFVQDNQSRSSRGVLRGLHYQLPPAAQGKLVRASRGAVFDVAVDIRRSSHNFGEWLGYELSESNFNQLWIPPGFAHGFLALTDDTELLYKTTDYYAPQLDRSIRWDDPSIGIDWPLNGMTPNVSPKDQVAPTLSEAEVFD